MGVCWNIIVGGGGRGDEAEKAREGKRVVHFCQAQTPEQQRYTGSSISVCPNQGENLIKYGV